MKPLIKQLDAAYVPAEWDGINRSGIRVVGKTVLVLMDTASGKSAGEHGGQIELTPDYIEKMTAQAISGVLVAVSEGAFCVNEDGSPWSGEKPKPGDRVNIAKYSGTRIPGRDKREYRLMDYGCIGGVYLPDEEYEAFVAAEEKRLNFDPDKAAILRAQLGEDGYAKDAPNNMTGGQDFGTSLKVVAGDHDWDPEYLTCRKCGVKMRDAEETPTACQEQSIGAAVAA